MISGGKKYYLATLPAKPELRTFAAAQLKEELGLDHFEGRPGTACTAMR
jgi:hypothetical protein